MSNRVRQAFQAAAGAAGGGLTVDQVFSTFLYTANSASRNIVTDLDMTEGGLVWIKKRNGSAQHVLVDSARGVGKVLRTNLADEEVNNTGSAATVTAFNNNGFSLGDDDGNMGVNNQPEDTQVAWSFRKAPKFMTLAQYTGNSGVQSIAHDLGSTPALMIVKSSTKTNTDWTIYHKNLDGGSNPEQYSIFLNKTDAQTSVNVWNNTAPTDTHFTVGANGRTNSNGHTYIAYLFADNSSEDAADRMISCNSYTGNGSSTGPVIDLGFEPQWVMIKRANASENWVILDTMRGLPNGQDATFLIADDNVAEATQWKLAVTSTGFSPYSSEAKVNASGSEYIYMAVRRDDQSEVTDATDVFAVATRTAVEPAYVSNFPVDMALRANAINNTHDTSVATRLTGKFFGLSTSTYQFQDGNEYEWDYTNGWNSNASNDTNSISWMWKRAKSYFDVTCWNGTGSNQTINHSLGVVPEMIWFKRRDSSTAGNWLVYHKSYSTSQALFLNVTQALLSSQTGNLQSTPSSTQFTVGTYNGVNNASGTYIAYLFATLANVSKVGSFTHSSGTDSTINCGFSNGARFVLLKKTDSADNWFFWDSVRGINSGTEPYLALNTTSGQFSTDSIDPHSSGFIYTAQENSGSYIFYAIA